MLAVSQVPAAPVSSSILLLLVVTLALLGLMLWLAGGRFSRVIMTLLMVTAGAYLGLRLPRAMGLSIAPWVGGLSLAAVLGAAGFLLHRVWVGAGLALALSAWVAVGVWAMYGTPDFQPPVRGNLIGARDYMLYGQSCWQALPAEVKRVGPFLCGLALVAGVTIAVLWQRLAGFALYSIAGVTLLLGVASLIMEMGGPRLLERIPANHSTQILLLGGMVLVGTIVQWTITPAPHGAGGGKKRRASQD